MQNQRSKAAEWSPTAESEETSGLPEKLENLGFNQLLRHDLMANTSNDVVKKIAEEMKVDNELGLVNQASITAKKSLMHDIDELTSSRDYFEVTPEHLKKLFKISSIQRRCLIYNIQSTIKGILTAGFLPIMLCLALIYPVTVFSAWVFPPAFKACTPFLALLSICAVLGWIGEIVLLIFGFTTWSGKKIRYTLMDVKLKTVPLSSVFSPIPYGAKLKVLEAKKTGIFEDFVYATPEFETTGVQKEVKYPTVDPAVLGVTKDKRMYMIVYWDLDKDVAKVVKQIKDFKKFKLHNNT